MVYCVMSVVEITGFHLEDCDQCKTDNDEDNNENEDAVSHVAIKWRSARDVAANLIPAFRTEFCLIPYFYATVWAAASFVTKAFNILVARALVHH